MGIGCGWDMGQGMEWIMAVVGVGGKVVIVISNQHEAKLAAAHSSAPVGFLLY